MAYTDPIKYRAARNRWREANPEKYRASQKAFDKRRKQRRCERQNEKNFRYKAREIRRAPSYEGLVSISRNELENPQFIFIYKGVSCLENLHSPLPCFYSKTQ